MAAIVIDTNVLLVANKDHDGISPHCVRECVNRLMEIQKSGPVVLDDGRRILKEYLENFPPRKQEGVGVAFMKWLLQNRANPAFVQTVHIDEIAPKEFAQFPDPVLQAAFDSNDRKFVATSAAHADIPPILQAADSKWVGWWAQLHAHGIEVQFPCPTDIKGFYKKKFPGVAVPPLPGNV